MSKKKFSSGLDELFADLHDSSAGGAVSEMTVRHRSDRKLPSVKSFAGDLDALLQDAMEESLNRLEEKENAGEGGAKTKSKKTGNPQHHFAGLDALIRQTIDVQEFTHEETTGVRRLTVAVDRTKLDKLKTIARLENAFLKDLLTGLIDEYIQEYASQKGLKL
jgi:hypothetical protein